MPAPAGHAVLPPQRAPEARRAAARWSRAHPPLACCGQESCGLRDLADRLPTLSMVPAPARGAIGSLRLNPAGSDCRSPATGVVSARGNVVLVGNHRSEQRHVCAAARVGQLIEVTSADDLGAGSSVSGNLRLRHRQRTSTRITVFRACGWSRRCRSSATASLSLGRGVTIARSGRSAGKLGHSG